MTQELITEWNKMQVMIEKNANLFHLNIGKLNKLDAYCSQNKNRLMYDTIGKTKPKFVVNLTNRYRIFDVNGFSQKKKT
jgi:hypothetical protein